jgi:hypothetical protein
MLSLVRDALFCIESGADARSSGIDGALALEVAIGVFASSAQAGAATELPLRDREARIVSR